MEDDKIKDDRSHNRENILRCATRLFYAKGYDAVGVQEIAEAAGITKPTLYYYFKSKYGLLESLLESKLSILNREIGNAAGQPGDITVILNRVAMVYLTTAEGDREFYFLMLALFYSARDNEAYQAIKPYLLEQFDIVKRIFERESGQLGNMHGRQEQFAIGFSGIINHYILVFYERNREEKGLADINTAYSLVHQFMHGIFS